jgi:hypothetical protein
MFPGCNAGSVSASLPAFTVPSLDLPTVKKLIEPAILTAVISYMITVSIAQVRPLLIR